jgi:hypothetical protein
MKRAGGETTPPGHTENSDEQEIHSPMFLYGPFSAFGPPPYQSCDRPETSGKFLRIRSNN